ncbi:MGMT family protein [Corynebacterium epidermidicanis]|uniref:6-O-methylguanine DNA methyltransferase, DNA binding domain n=1 Tax=Corynebacterium epidermidicanis TaxID=1050174 RepID=A0A0G3GT93_9CORY|nr:MGMT family protein [Corynebacterium epidermidicanis]AKK02077.1 6-O-methylguanine DNA methyltransferase, DNA binding domain [Corynebacterium epidermidicanis]
MSSPELADRVLAIVARIPRGQVMTYGEVGAEAGCGPRQVGRIMRECGSEVAWWRVVRADGSSALAERARPHWLADGLPMRGERVDLRSLGPESPE